MEYDDNSFSSSPSIAIESQSNANEPFNPRGISKTNIMNYATCPELWANLTFLAGSTVYVWISVLDFTCPTNADEEISIKSFSKGSAENLIHILFYSGFSFQYIKHFSYTLSRKLSNMSILDFMCSDFASCNLLKATGPFLYIIHAVIDARSAYIEKLSWDVVIAAIFGVGALLDFSSVISNNIDSNYMTSRNSLHSEIAVHLYLIRSSLATIWTHKNSLLQAGGVLFLLGSVINVVVSFFDKIVMIDEQVKIMTLCNLLSSLLWLGDGILRTLAGFMWEYEADD
mmetsp:Transcript_435/g.625  ORF Transcript_435/g.625 Transcript_435/m.625 type:complete len:285 (+) Transcript_435:274-1128(+)